MQSRAALLSLLPVLVIAADNPPRFERDILPIFSANCFNCHNAGSLVGLDLRTAESTLRGSHQGQVVVKGDPQKSRLYLKVSSRDMPPPAFKLKLTDTEIQTIKEWIAAGAPYDEPSRSGVEAETVRFDQRIKPLFESRCVSCHGGGKPAAGLDLRTLDGVLRGSSNGPVIVEGSADKSLLIRKIASRSMPPKGVAQPLNDAEIKTVGDWIDSARFRSSGTATTLRETFSEAEAPAISEKDREHWAFRPPVRRPIPRARHGASVVNPIDAFVISKLESKGLALSSAASKAQLIRRAYLDLTGLPPTPGEVNEFLGDTRANAYERLIDNLLASRQYGVRWARHWLDSAGYTDTTGQETIFEGIWRYRDYVVDSLNTDKPYDQFLIEQIAGDELVDWRTARVFTPEILQTLVATGYLRSTFDRTDADITNLPQERYDVLIDLVDKVSSGVLGLTVGCARCHSHKFDPIPQRDYYRLMTVFSSSYNPWSWTTPQKRFIAGVPREEREAIDRHNAKVEARETEVKRKIAALRAPYDAKIFEKKLQTLPAEIREDVKAAVKLPAEERDEIQRFLARKFTKALTVEPAESEAAFSEEDRNKFRELDAQVKALERTRQAYDKIQALWDTGPPPRMRLLQRGVLVTPGPMVDPGFLTVLSAPGKSDFVRPSDARGETSGQRLAFVRWLVSKDHPLTARVMVNRVWQHHFGKGIVETPDNFGRMGGAPSHPELLDWLAVDFMEHGWSLKRLHKMIMTSATYRQASRQTDKGNATDPENRLLWRMNLVRLESETIRDCILAASGKLDLTMGGPAVLLKPQPNGLQEISDDPAVGAGKFRRSLYLEARRGYPLTFLEVFDSPLMQTSCNRRQTSVTPLQSLTLMNSDFIVKQAEFMAERVAALKPQNIVEAAFEIALGRKPEAPETRWCESHLESQTKAFQGSFAGDRAERKALASLCQVLLSGNEFIYRD